MRQSYEVVSAGFPSGTSRDEARFELRYRSLSPYRCDYAFPCDAQGQVNLDQLSERARENYLNRKRRPFAARRLRTRKGWS